MNPRAQAAKIITKVTQNKRSLSLLLKDKDPLIKEFCYGTLRWYFQLSNVAAQLLHTPIKSKYQDVHSLLLIGLYQLIYMRIPEHAVVNETVSAARALKKPWARRLINKTLHKFLANNAINVKRYYFF